jgi:hypothetical protein
MFALLTLWVIMVFFTLTKGKNIAVVKHWGYMFEGGS